jgi:hypothetical protein
MSPLSNSAHLRLTISLAEPHVNYLSALFWNYEHLDELFPEYLFTLHCSMRATVPLLEAAAARSEVLSSADPVAAKLTPYFLQHAREELHHDEWLLEDMQAVGIDTTAVLRRLPPADVAEMIGAQHYWVRHAHPISVLGCFAVLEGDPPQKETLNRVMRERGIPQEALRTLLKHAELDPHHSSDLDRVLDDLPLEHDHLELLGISSLHTIEQLGGILRRLLVEAGHPGLSSTSPSIVTQAAG